MIRRRYSAAVCALLAAHTLLAACSSLETSSDTDSSIPDSQLFGDVQSESWNSDMDVLAATTSSEQVKNILADHVISEAEIRSLQDEMRACLKPQGFTTVTFQLSDTDNGYQTNTPSGLQGNEVEEALNACEDTVGYSAVAVLYAGIHANPTRQDRTEDIVACLRDKKLVPDTYTADDFRRDSETSSLPLTEDTMEDFSQCLNRK